MRPERDLTPFQKVNSFFNRNWKYGYMFGFMLMVVVSFTTYINHMMVQRNTEAIIAHTKLLIKISEITTDKLEEINATKR